MPLITLRMRRRSYAAGPPAGFTLVELLVAIGVVGLLAAILLPAIQASRAVSQRTTCASNLRQLAVAAQHHAAAYGVYQRSAPLTDLLPFVEARMPTNEDRAQVEVYQCPSEPHPDWGNPWTAAYFMNDGSHIYFKPDGIAPQEGVLSYYAGIRPRDVTDGESNTGMFSERQLPPKREQHTTREEVAELFRRYPVVYVWKLGTTFVYGQEDAFLSACGDPARRQPLGFGWSNQYGIQSTDRGYKHVLPPNVPGCEYFTPPKLHHHWVLGEWDTPANSGHSGGVNLSLCDGATKFVADGIDVHVWRAIGTRNEGDVIGPY